MIRKINQVGMVELPKEMCKALKLAENAPVYISIENRKIILQNFDSGENNVIMRKVDELNRIVLPMRIRQFLKVKYNDTISLKLDGKTIILAKGVVTYITTDKKEQLDKRNQRELENMKYKKSTSSLFYIMEDFYNIITLGRFSENEVEKMLAAPKLLEHLAALWQDDERAMELQERVLGEFLSVSNE